ncbi:MAG: amidohydrolase/deacetylase family metallohydrolase [Alphaproteobacteria bacterium]|nr:amidohydrolase/deacetylase family metallohydrolase [Alphaproteobacteria bacterium]
MTYDLLLKGGHVIDPATGRDGVLDVAFAGGKVAAVAERISEADAREVRQAGGFYVVPGLIDLHTHVYWGGTVYGVDPDKLARASGMTTAVDAGSAGAANIRGLVDLQQSRTDIRLLAFVNLTFPGIYGDLRAVAVAEADDLRLLNVPHVVRTLKTWPDQVVGIKIRVGRSSTGALGAMPLHLAISASEQAGNAPVMAHIGADMPPRLEEIMDPLRQGDIVTHCYTPKMNKPLTTKGQLRDCMVAGRERGVIMDVGHGAGSFGFDVCRAMLELGFAPDVISSDVHLYSADGPAYDVLVTMSKFLCLGLPLADVIRAATSAPAAAMRRTDIGTLKPGAAGDAALLEIRKGPVAYVDAIGGEMKADKRLVPRGIVLGGKWWSDGMAPTLNGGR